MEPFTRLLPGRPLRRGILGRLAAAVFLFASLPAFSADPVVLPLDPLIRYGRLDNGLTYYIRHNGHPENRADFYIAQRVGSMQEEDNQRGLAHFLEHMAFNGTRHFPDKTLIEYLESVGAKFGANINAYTSFDETVYTLMDIPVIRPGIVDSCLLILSDWSDGILLLDEEIDKERGVIQEEWRTRDNATMRMWDQLLPQMLPGSKYAHRMPIGTMEVVMNFPYQDLRDYYHKWYRTDLQGIIVVGDIDVDYVENRLKEYFVPKTLDEDRAERELYGVPDNTEPIVAYGSDKETTLSRLTVYFKHDPEPDRWRGTDRELLLQFKKNAIASMLDERAREIVHAPDPPFIAAGFYDGEILGVTKTKEAFTAVALCGEEKIREAFAALLREVRRVGLHGFTEPEYRRFVSEFMSRMENYFLESDTRKNGSLAREYVRNFIDGEAVPGIEQEYRFYQERVPGVSLEEINALAKELIRLDNVILTVQTPEQEEVEVPGREEILEIFRESMESLPEPYAEEDALPGDNESGGLVGALPEPGAILSETSDELFGATTWILSNGARVVILPTDHKNDQILMSATRFGGWSQIPEKYDAEVKFLNSAASIGGLGRFDAVRLPRMLAGKNVSVSASVGELAESLRGNCSPADLETLMELIYLRFTGIRQDDDAYRAWKDRTAIQLRNIRSDPSYVWSDSLQGILYQYNPRKMNATVEELEAADYDSLIELYRERFADASGFTFLFVGNVDPETLRPLAETYIASLPGQPGEHRPGRPAPLREGMYDSSFTRKMESPKVSVFIDFSGYLEPTLENIVTMDMVEQALFSRYTETLREEEGGTYGARVRARIEPLDHRARLTVSFDTNQEQYETLRDAALGEINRMTREEITDAEFHKIREYLLKKHAEDLKENSYWLNMLNGYEMFGRDYLHGYREAVRGIDRAQISALLRELTGQGNRVTVTMNGIK